MGQVNAQSWESIESHYADLNEHGWGHDRLLALVQHIKSTEFSQRLFAVTSLSATVIRLSSDTKPLRIEFDRASQLFIFKYCLQQLRVPEFYRQYPGELGIENLTSSFDGFVGRITKKPAGQRAFLLHC